ncbi:hypothetical protein [Bacteroides clarus]|uniref:hypothetical protein n=1 Tax=Bacteroides clarus TaxID=626929 RepID=UPI00248DC70E|nr:hypothetical protein [Bacteroides clarus]
MIANVKIEQDKQNEMIHRVFVNGEKLKRVNHIDLNIDVDEAPQVNVGIVGGCDFEGMADIHFDYSPYTVKEACKILRDELLKNVELYNGFISSIESSLKEQKVTGLPFQPESEIAEKILKRIIGEE